jgi:hypothetical protein
MSERVRLAALGRACLVTVVLGAALLATLGGVVYQYGRGLWRLITR